MTEKKEIEDHDTGEGCDNYEIIELDASSKIDKQNIPIKYCRKHANRICALSKGEGCLAQQGTGDYCELQMGSGYISLGSSEDAEIEVSGAHIGHYKSMTSENTDGICEVLGDE